MTHDEELDRAVSAPWFGDCALCAHGNMRISLWFGDSEEEVRGIVEAHVENEHPDLIRVWRNR